MRSAKLRTWAGVAGPVVFITAWSALGARRSGYDPVHDPISRLAAVGTSTRPAMTAGFVAFTAGVGAYAPVLRANYGAATGRAATLTAAATLGVAALPLDGPGGDQAHAVAAFAAYATLAAVPFFASRAQREAARRQATATAVPPVPPVPARSVAEPPISYGDSPTLGQDPYEIGGRPRSAAVSLGTAVAIAGALTASAVLPHHVGLAQRIGLTLGDAWIVASAVAALRANRQAT